MTTAEIETITLIIEETYGVSPMVDAMIDVLVDRIEEGSWDSWDSRGREFGIMCICWDWCAGGDTADEAAARITEALRDAIL